ncbi:MAG: DNA polymerase III subunit delta [Oscillospiraceae bacterium]|nr:DNA polymerase III subunit delta [Oscillospiraceae bacterium]
MAEITESSLKTAIKNGQFERAYYFYGKDIAAVEAYAKKIASKAVDKDNETCNLHSFDGKSFDIDTFSDACEALPFFADYICCMVCDLNAEGLTADTIKRLTEIVSDLPETTILVFYYTSVDVTDGKKYPTAKNKKLMDAVSKVGGVCNFALKSPAALAKEIMAKASKAGCGISKEAAEFLAVQCSCNTLLIENELHKLTSYAEGNEITTDIIRELSPRQIETTTFDLAKAICRMDRRTALRLLNDLTEEKIEPISILYAVTGNMVDLYRARAAISCRKTPANVKEDFGYPKNMLFRVDNAFRDVQKIPMPHLRNCMRILADTDAAMKSSRTDNQILLEEAIVKMLSYGGKSYA